MKNLGRNLGEIKKNAPKEILDFFLAVFETTKDEQELYGTAYLLEKEEDYKEIKLSDYYIEGDLKANLYESLGILDFHKMLENFVAISTFLTDDGGDIYFVPADLINQNLKKSLED